MLISDSTSWPGAENATNVQKRLWSAQVPLGSTGDVTFAWRVLLYHNSGYSPDNRLNHYLYLEYDGKRNGSMSVYFKPSSIVFRDRIRDLVNAWLQNHDAKLQLE